MNSPTLSVWTLSLIGLGLGEGIGALAEAPYAVVGVESMALAIISKPSNKPTMGVPMVTETSLLVG